MQEACVHIQNPFTVSGGEKSVIMYGKGINEAINSIIILERYTDTNHLLSSPTYRIILLKNEKHKKSDKKIQIFTSRNMICVREEKK
jgi:hypothetical protein